MALARVQATGRVTAAGTTSVSLTFATPPTVGNGIVVLAAIYQTAGTALTCSDNRGNTYALAIANGASPSRAVIYYCAGVTASAAPFTVTLSLATTSGYFEAVAIEVSGVGTGLTVDQTASGFDTGASTAVSTGTTAALTASEVFVAAVHALRANQASLVVQPVSPPWIEEFENLNYSATIAGEGDTRLLTGVAGTTQTCSWTAATAAGWNAVLAAFAATAPATPDARISQLVVETLGRDAPPEPRVTQLVVETLSGLAAVLPDARLTQLVVETLTATPVPFPRVSQLIVETLTATPVPHVPARVTQVLAELFALVPPSPVTATQAVAEIILALGPQPDHTRVTQIACELIIVRGPLVCPAELPIDEDTDPHLCAVDFPVKAITF